MARFKYSALKENEQLISGQVEAIDLREARKKLKEMGFIPISLVDPEASKKKDKGQKANVSSLSLKERIDFTQTLQILSSTGIPIIESLLFIEQNSDSKKTRKITYQFRQDIIGGSTLGDALEKYRDIFGRVYIGLVKAGEDSGELDKTLSRMLELLKKQDAVKGKVVGALIYPTAVIMLAIVAVLVMLIFVFPAFDAMFKDMGRELPWVTQVCMNAGNFLKDKWIICVVFLCVAFIGGNIAYKKPSVRKGVDAFVLHVPMLSTMFKYSNFSNFISVLQVCYEAGIPIVNCLQLGNLTMDNAVLREAIRYASDKVKQGTHLSVAFKNINQVPTMVTFMIATGEQSGRLGDSLMHCVNYIDKRLDAVIDAFTKLIEPLLMIGIGLLVGFLGLALYLPLFQSYQG